jgi:hypothetical protein
MDNSYHIRGEPRAQLVSLIQYGGNRIKHAMIPWGSSRSTHTESENKYKHTFIISHCGLFLSSCNESNICHC